MSKVKMNTQDIIGLLVGTNEERMNCLSKEEVFSSLEINDIKYIYQKELDSLREDDSTESEVVLLLQELVYNRHKSQYSEEIATFVFDKLFEMIISGDINF